MEETGPKTFVFVLMPFSDDFQDIYEVGIKAACRDAGAYCERVDEQIFTDNILERILNQIARADVIVADMTGRNPNVFYETGYAHALNKTVILLTKEATDIPFDLKQYPHIIYEGKIARLKTELERRIRWCVENVPASLSSVDLTLAFSIDGVPLTDIPTVEVNRVNYVHFGLDIHNPSTKIIDPQSYNLALIIPRKARFLSPNVLSGARMTSGEYIYTLEHRNRIFPLGWVTLRVELELFGVVAGETIDLVLRFFTELGFRDYQFRATTY